MLKCPITRVPWVPKCLSVLSAWVPACLRYLSARVPCEIPPSFQVPSECPSAWVLSESADLFSSKSTQKLLEYSNGARWALKGHSKGTPRTSRNSRHLVTWVFKALGYLGTQDTSALRHLRHLDTWTLRHFRTCALKGYLGTQVFRHFGSRGTRGTLFSRLAKELHLSPFIQDCQIQKCFSYPILECKLCRRI